jgi:hypothetical protein
MEMIVSIAGSIVATVIVALFLQTHIDQLRRSIAERNNGWLKRRYTRAFLSAVRGGAEALDTSILAFAVATVPVISGAYLWHLSESAERGVAQLQAQFESARAARDGAASAAPSSTGDPLAVIAGELGELAAETSKAALLGRSAACGLWLSAVLAGFLWIPFVVTRRLFSFELNRFNLRIQGLASKAELAEIAVAEVTVRDERSLRAFVSKAREVAARHGIPQLVDTFDLWGE